jgi:hypothetical protein
MSVVDAVAEALWLDASKERFGTFAELDQKPKELWRKSARAAIKAMGLAMIDVATSQVRT